MLMTPKLYIQLSVQGAGVQKGLNLVKNELAQTDKAVAATTGKLGGLSKAFGSMARIAGGIILFDVIRSIARAFRGAISATTDFEAAMRNVNSIAQLSEDQFKALNAQVLQLALDPRIKDGPAVLAAGLYDIVSSGFDTADALIILQSASIAATAGLTTTAVSAAAVTAVLNAYGLQAADASGVSDILFQTVNLGVLTFDELANSIGTVLPTAKAAGVSLIELGAAYATLTRQGVNADEATTQINAVITGLLKPTDALTEALAAQGYESGEALIKAKGFGGALEVLSGIIDGSATKANELFGDVRQVRGILGLTTDQGELYVEMLKEMGYAQDGAGATAKALAQQMKSNAFQISVFKKNLQILAVLGFGAIARPLNWVIRGINTFLVTIIKGLPAFGKFVKLLSSTSGLTGAILKFAKHALIGFNQIKYGLDLLGRSFNEGATTILRGLGKLLGSGPRLIGDFLRGLKTGFAPLDNLLHDVGDQFTDAGLLIQHIFQGEWGKAFDSAVDLVKDRANLLLDTLKLELDFAKVGFTLLLDGVPKLAGKIADVAGNIYGWIKQQLFGDNYGMGDGTGERARLEPITFGDVVLQAGVVLGGKAAAVASDVWGWIKDQFSAGPTQDPMLRGLDTHQAVPIGTVYILPTLKLAADVDWGGIAKDIGTGIVGAVRDAVYAFSPLDMATFTNQLGLAIGPAISSAVSKAFDAFTADPVGSAKLALKILAGVGLVITSAVWAPVILAGALATWVAAGIVGFVAGILGFDIDFNSAAKAILGSITDAFKSVTNFASEMASAVSDGLSNLSTEDVSGIITTLSDAIADLITPDSFKTLGTAIATGLYEAIKTALKALVPQNVFDWLTADAAMPPFQDERRFQSEASSSPGTLKGGQIVTTLPAVGTGAMPDFASMLKIAQQFRDDFANVLVGLRSDAGQIVSTMRQGIANELVGLRDDAATIVESLGTGAENLFVGMRNDLVSLAESARNGVANAFVGMRNDVSSIIGDLVGIASDGGYAIGDSIGSGLYYGMTAWIGTISNAAYDMVTEAISAARVAAGNPHSPSPVSYKLIGSPIGEGVYKGIVDWQKPIAGAMGSLVPFGAPRTRPLSALPTMPRLSTNASRFIGNGSTSVTLHVHGNVYGMEDLETKLAQRITPAMVAAIRTQRRALGRVA